MSKSNEKCSVLPTSMSSLTCSCWSLNSPKASIIRPISNRKVATLEYLAIFTLQVMSVLQCLELSVLKHLCTQAQSWEWKVFFVLYYSPFNVTPAHLFCSHEWNEFSFSFSWNSCIPSLVQQRELCSSWTACESASHLKHYSSIFNILRKELDHSGDCDICNFFSV